MKKKRKKKPIVNINQCISTADRLLFVVVSSCKILFVFNETNTSNNIVRIRVLFIHSVIYHRFAIYLTSLSIEQSSVWCLDRTTKGKKKNFDFQQRTYRVVRLVIKNQLNRCICSNEHKDSMNIDHMSYERSLTGNIYLIADQLRLKAIEQ
jgi:hypothetical protein